MRPIAFVSGPFRGDVEANIQAAARVAAALLNKGYTVICPHTMTSGLAENGCTLTDEEHIERLLALVEVSDILVSLPGWQDSAGSIRERNHAKVSGTKCFDWPDVWTAEEWTAERRIAW